MLISYCQTTLHSWSDRSTIIIRHFKNPFSIIDKAIKWKIRKYIEKPYKAKTNRTCSPSTEPSTSQQQSIYHFRVPKEHMPN